METLALFVFISAVCSPVVFGMDCTLGTSKNIVDKVFHSCPGLTDSNDKSYCCFNIDNDVHCCTVYDFIIYGVGWLLPVIIVGILLSTIISCICCFCCCCRRQGGRGNFI